jgi:hypothetical protein
MKHDGARLLVETKAMISQTPGTEANSRDSLRQFHCKVSLVTQALSMLNSGGLGEKWFGQSNSTRSRLTYPEHTGAWVSPIISSLEEPANIS